MNLTTKGGEILVGASFQEVGAGKSAALGVDGVVLLYVMVD